MNMHNDTPDKQTLSQLMDGEWHDIDPARCVAHACADESLKAAWARWHLVRDALRGEAGPIAVDASLALRISAAIEAEPGYTNVTPWPGAPVRAPMGQPVAAGPVPDSVSDSVSDSAPGATAIAAALPPAGLAAAMTSNRGGARGARTTGFGGFGVAGLGMTGVALAASAAFVAVIGLDAWQGGAAPDAEVPGTAGLRVATGLTSQSPLLPLPAVDLVANTNYPDGSYWVSEGDGARRGEAEARLNALLSRHIESAPTATQQSLLPYSRLVGYDRPDAGTDAGVSEGR